MINEIAVWWIIFTGVLMPVILGYMLTVVMKLDKKVIEVGHQMARIDTEHILLSTDYQKINSALTDLQLEDNQFRADIDDTVNMNQTLCDDQDIIVRRHEDLEERVNQLDIIVTHNITEGHNKQIATLEKQVRRLFAMHNELVEAKSEEVVDSEPEQTPETKAEPLDPRQFASTSHYNFLQTIRNDWLLNNSANIWEDVSEAISNNCKYLEGLTASGGDMLTPKPAFVSVGNDFGGQFAEWLTIKCDHRDFPKVYKCDFHSNEMLHTLILGRQEDLVRADHPMANMLIKDVVDGAYTNSTLWGRLRAFMQAYSSGWYVLVASEVYSESDTNLKHWDVSFCVFNKRKYARTIYNCLKQYMDSSCYLHRHAGSDYQRKLMGRSELSATFKWNSKLEL